MGGISERIGDVLGAALDNKLEREVRSENLPQHVAIIMDGNRRFAWSTSIPEKIGHRKGREKLEEVMDWVLEFNIPHFTVYALSTENLKTRSEKELEQLFDLYVEGFTSLTHDPRIHNNQVKIRCVGNLELLPQRVLDAVSQACESTKEYERNIFTTCLAYGSREEILSAIRLIASSHAAGEITLEEIDEAAVASNLYTKGLPDPDLIIRTSGEERISNFLLWQAAYAELYFTDVYWPRFSRRDFLKAIRDFQRRQRRFGS